MSKSFQVLALLAFLTVPARASAQVTTAIFHSSRRPSPEEAKRRADSLNRADSAATAAEILAMHRWVDSAGRSIGAGSHHNDDTLPGVVNRPTALNDTTAAHIVGETLSTRPQPGRSNGRTAEFHDGAVAPVTATSLPLLLASGAVMLALGTVLMRLRGRNNKSA